MYELSDEDLRFFGENGYLGPFDSPWSLNEIEEARKHCLEVMESENPNYDLSRCVSPQEGLVPENYLKVRDRHLDDYQIFDMIRHPAITERVAQVLGPDLLVWRTQMFKNIRATQEVMETEHSVGFVDGWHTIWHQGANFAGGTGRPVLVPSTNLTLWMSLTDSNPDNGTLMFLPGTHALGALPLANGGDRGRFLDGLKYRLDYSRRVELDVKPGQFVLFDEYLVHGSKQNTSTMERLALTARYSTPFTYIMKKTMPWPEHLCPELPNPKGAGPDMPRLQWPVEDCEYDNWNMALDNWGCVLVRGEDRYGINKLVDGPEADYANGRSASLSERPSAPPPA